MSIELDIQAAATEVGTSAQAAADRVLAAVATAATKALAELQTAKDALQAEIDRGAANAAALVGVVENLTTADAIIDGIAPAPVVEPPPVEEFPVEA